MFYWASAAASPRTRLPNWSLAAEARRGRARGDDCIGDAIRQSLTFQALSGNAVHTDLLDAEAENAMDHISLARWADLLIVARPRPISSRNSAMASPTIC